MNRLEISASGEDKDFLPFVDDWFTDYYKGKHIDPIYGEIEILDYQQKIIRTPHFNRLRDLKQMGEAHYVFSNAQQTRFSHSVGVAHLAKQMYRHLTIHSLSNRYNALEEMLVVTAAMLHDLGHGAFSHTFEIWAAGKFNHEEMSLQLIWHAIEQGYFDFITVEPLHAAVPSEITEHAARKQWVTLHNYAIICAMIQDTSETELAKLVPSSKFWLFDIVHNNIIDVDRMDYLVRDMHAVYGSTSPNVRMTQIIDSTRIVNGRVRFNLLACNQLYEALYLRASMHKNVYTHDGVVAVKQMFLDLLHMIDAETDFSITKAIRQPETFLLLSDCVFQPWFTMRQNPSTTASQLMRRIETQDHYVVVARKIVFSVPNHVTIDRVLQAFTSVAKENSFFSKDSLFITQHRFDLGCGTQDPLRDKIFYRATQYGDERECYKSSDSSSCFFDSNHSSVEYLVRLYAKIQPDTVPIIHWQQLCSAFYSVVKNKNSLSH